MTWPPGFLVYIALYSADGRLQMILKREAALKGQPAHEGRDIEVAFRLFAGLGEFRLRMNVVELLGRAGSGTAHTAGEV